eukprot:1570123-Pyramimonas_sp.AAC.1
MATRSKGFHFHIDWAPLEGKAASGTGGRTTPIGRCWVPCSLAGCGYIEYYVLEQQCPPCSQRDSWALSAPA